MPTREDEVENVTRWLHRHFEDPEAKPGGVHRGFEHLAAALLDSEAIKEEWLDTLFEEGTND